MVLKGALKYGEPMEVMIKRSKDECIREDSS